MYVTINNFRFTFLLHHHCTCVAPPNAVWQYLNKHFHHNHNFQYFSRFPMTKAYIL